MFLDLTQQSITQPKLSTAAYIMPHPPVLATLSYKVYQIISPLKYRLHGIQARIAQLVAYRLGTSEVPGSNPGKGENF